MYVSGEFMRFTAMHKQVVHELLLRRFLKMKQPLYCCKFKQLSIYSFD